MVRHLAVIACLMLVACGGDSKKPPPKKPVVKKTDPEPPADTAATRAEKREQAANKIVPKDSTCLPLTLKEGGAPQLELAAVGTDAVICANDLSDSMLGMVGCWTIALKSGEIAWRSREPVPSRGYVMKLDGKCAGDICLPKESKVPDDRKALIAWNADASKIAMLVGDDLHVYTSDKAHEAAWGIRQDKGITAEPQRIHWVGEHIFIESSEGVWVYKAADGTPVGPIVPIGAKDQTPLPTKGGSFVILDKTRVAISEQGYSNVHTYEADTGKRAKIVRKLAKSPCKPAETEAYWKGEEAPPKCKEHMDKNFAHLVGADAVAGSKNLLVLLRGSRLGELAVLDAKTLAEKNAIRLPWCDEEDGNAAKTEDKPAKKSDEEESE